MRLLFVIPHYFGAGPQCYGSTDVSQRERRIASLRNCIASLHRHFGTQQYLLLDGGDRRQVNRMMTNVIDIVVCITGASHLVEQASLPAGSFRTYEAQVDDPRLLGFSCYQVLRKEFGSYDWYCYLEDDIVIDDPLFFWKLRAFYDEVKDARYLLQPNRFEVADTEKAYIDGPVWEDSAEFLSRLRLPGGKDEVRISFGPTTFRMVPAENPHAGCSFLTPTHLQHMLEQPWYGEPVVGYAGPLESAATMYALTLFHLFKPADDCVAFLEVRHGHQRFLKEP